jgi:hypothetical protein
MDFRHAYLWFLTDPLSRVNSSSFSLEETRMAKIKTSKKRNASVTNSFVKHPFPSNLDLADKKIVREILTEALLANDLEVFQDVLVGYLRTSSKLTLSRNTRIGRTTLYDLMNPEKPFNPTLDTLGKIFAELAA